MRKCLSCAAVLITAAVFVSAFFVSCGTPDVSPNEIRLRIRLDLGEEIGLLLIGSDVNGSLSEGGASNADKSMLGKDEVIYWSIDKQHSGTVSDSADVTLSFSVVTEYFPPNYGNNYPQECVIHMPDISFAVQFGKSYDVPITGDKVNGYHAYYTGETP